MTPHPTQTNTVLSQQDLLEAGLNRSPADNPPREIPRLIGMDLAALEAMLADWGEPAFRARQLHSWIYVHAVRDIEAMTNLSKGLRNRLHQDTRLGQLELVDKQISRDGTTKYLFRLEDGNVIESVWMPFQERESTSICVSTQVGCAVNCGFCATGKLGLKRHLSAAEIVEQLLYVRHDSGQPINNLVFMGQGEPLHNYDAFIEALRLINQSAELGMRHITVSTAGLVPQIRKLADEQLQLTLAVSLHAPDDDTRNRFMPINQRYPIAELMGALQYYYDQTHRRLTIEYILLAGLNDSDTHAQALGNLLETLHCNINLIPYNPIGAEYGFKRPDRLACLRFKRTLEAHSRHKVTIRLERGTDIDAACGQLANRHQAPARS
ncbi:MAG: 23S rRNA (adenine(2503)-C(2))-methyltransferase RlmN [Cyanobacteria bacterium HKST-UBA03]|nr:23S rRNA (adenine(2503)-C(2))-methyltransferase RlmN [Cyanobacteria bacterium HKST-UBA03]